MSLDISQGSNDEIMALLAAVRGKGVRMWAKNGQLHYQAPKGALSPQDIETLRARRAQLVPLIERANAAERSELKPAMGTEACDAQLSFSQLAHWHLYGLPNSPSIRQIASATRLRGDLDVNVLCASVAEVLRRNTALRTRIVVGYEGPRQKVVELGSWAVPVVELTVPSEAERDVEIQRRIEQLIIGPVHVMKDPLLVVQLLKFDEDDYVLLAAMEHLICDQASMNIFLREIFATYLRGLRGLRVTESTVSMQLADFAAWQHRTVHRWLEKHGAYWKQRLAGCQRLKFPVDPAVGNSARPGWERVPVHVDSAWTSELREWCRSRRTTLVIGVLTAYVALLFRWCNVDDEVVAYQSDGRDLPELQNTIGYLASILYLRIRLHHTDNFLDLLSKVFNEYCQAQEHADYSYLESQRPRAEFAYTSCFNWIPQADDAALSDQLRTEAALEYQPIEFVHPMFKSLQREDEPFILLYETQSGIGGHIGYKLSRHSAGSMERFGRNFMLFLRTLILRPTQPIRDLVISP